MHVQRVAQRGSDVEITTTGAVLRFDGRGVLHVDARLPVSRPLARVQIAARGAPVVELVTDEVHLRIGRVRATVRPDSVVRFAAAEPADIRVEPLFEPEYRARRRGRQILLDRRGGLGIYPLRPRAFGRRWLGTPGSGPDEEVWVAFFPPRPPSPRRLAEPLAHEGRPRPFPSGAYPGPGVIEDAARHCRIFALHGYFWDAAAPADRPRFGRYAGRRASWRTRRHEPAAPELYRELAQRVRVAGMQLVLYVSPQHMRAEDPLREIERVLGEFAPDGLYLDGVGYDLRTLDRVVRHTRRLLGDERVLYLNASDQPFRSVRVTCPFVDAWADLVLRGDSGRGGLSRDRFLRFAVSGRNVSNAVGHWCHYGSSGSPVPRDAPPAQCDITAALGHGVRLWRRGQAWTANGHDLTRFDDMYYPRLSETLRSEAAGPLLVG